MTPEIVRSSRHPVAVGLAFVLAVAGMVISAVLLQHHVVAQIGGDPFLGATCRVTATASCDDVIASKWGKVEFGPAGDKTIIPTAWVGFAWFATVAAWYVVIGVPTDKRRWLHLVPTSLTLGALVGAIGFEYVMFAVLGKYCPLCVATHVLILALFILTLVMLRRGPLSMSATAGPDAQSAAVELSSPSGRLVFVAVLLAVSLSASGWFGYQYFLKSGYAREYFTRWQDYDKDARLNYDKFLAQPVFNVPVSPDDPVLGPADSKFTVVVYSDFLCPACQGLNLMLEEYFKKYFPGQFRIVYKHFPLDTVCNKAIPHTMHPSACAAAVAAEAVLKLRGNDPFWKMHDAFFANAGKFTRQWAIDKAGELGIPEQEYIDRINTYAVWERIHRNIAEAKQLGVDSTPAMFFNGRLLKPWGDRHMWQYLLSEETLRAAGSQPASAPASGPAVPSAPATASQPR